MPGSLLYRFGFIRFVVSQLLFLCLWTGLIFAQFPIDPATNVPISRAFDSQTNPVIVSDGNGGAIIAWEDFRSGQGKDIYIQRINALGIMQWDTNGISICAEPGIQDLIVMIPDGAGGAILAWEDKRTDTDYDIYAQRISSSGTVLWSAGGIPVAIGEGEQEAPSMVSDGEGGAIFVWNDSRPGAASTIYAQRVNGSGTPVWTMGGVPVLRAEIASSFEPPAVISDGEHGAIVAWDDWRSNETDADIYIQRIDGNGASRWDTAGVAVCTDSATQYQARLASDGAGGAIACWTDWRTQERTEVFEDIGIYAQRVDSSGNVRWTENGVMVMDTTDRQEEAAIVSDGSGGAIISWADRRNETDHDIYAQRIDSSGTRLWAQAGVPVCSAFEEQGLIEMASDSAGGALIAWADNRTAGFDIFGQRVSSTGIALWAANGNPIVTADGLQALRGLIMSDTDRAILTWIDGRGPDEDVYVQNVNLDGYLGQAPALVLPADGAELNTDSVRLVWNSVIPKATKYWLELGLDSAFSFRSSDSTITDTTYILTNLSTTHPYWWKIRGFDNGWGPFSEVRKFSITIGVGVAEENTATPKVFGLEQNYPNPFNPKTVVSSQLPVVSDVKIVVYDLLGREVAVLVNERRAAGVYHDSFDASGLASGVYVYRMKAGSFADTKKLLLVR